MPIDPLIAGSGNITPLQNPMDVQSKLMNMQSLRNSNQLQQNQLQMQGVDLQKATQAASDDKAMRDAYANNTSVNKDTGMPSIDNAGLMKDLANNAPHLVPKMQVQLAQNQMEKTKILADQADLAAQGLQGAKDEASYQALKSTPLAMSAGSDKWPANYDPKFVANMASQALNHKDFLASQLAAQDVENKKQQLALDSFKVFGNPNGPVPRGTPTDANGKIAVDPATWVTKKAPMDLRSKINDELTMAQTASKAAPDAMGAFWKAANNKHIADLIPGTTNVDQKALMTALDPTFKDADPGARQAARDKFVDAVTPRVGDNQNTINTKAQMLQAHFNTRLYAPSAKEAGIDTNKFASTSVDDSLFKNPALAGNIPHPQDSVALAWARANPGPKADAILKANGVSSTASR